MADTFSGFLNLVRPEVGGSRDAWGDKWNDNANKIDTWASATDALAKAAVSKTVATEQAMAGVLKLSAGGTVPRAQKMVFGLGYISETVSYFETILGDANQWRIVNNGYTAELFRVDTGGAYVKNQVVYHTGNFTPGNYFDRTQAGQQQLAGPFSINMANPYFDLTYGNVMRLRQIVDSNGTWIVRNGDSGDNFFYVTSGGAVYTKQFGDLNTRIEARGGAYRDDAVNRANQYYEDRAPFRTNVAGQQRVVGDMEIFKAYPAVSFHYSGNKEWRVQVRENGWLYFGEDFAAQFRIAFQAGTGNIWSVAWGGYLTDYVEARAKAWGADAIANANAYYEARAPIRGNVGGEQSMAGALKISMANPYIRWEYPGVSQWYQQLQGDRYFRWYADGTQNFSFGPGGDLWMAQFGDLNNRIETRAGDYANDRLNTATNRINNKSLRFVLAGDLDNTWNYDGGFGEPYGGAVITTRRTTTGGNGPTVTGMRWRYAQMSNSDGAWYTVQYA
jgi:hypothetical protein